LVGFAVGPFAELVVMTHRPTPLRSALAALGVVVGLVILSACSGGEVRDAAGKVVNAGSWSVFDLRPGDCLNPADDLSGDISEVAVVPCMEPHAQEVFATVKHPEGPYPGAAAVSTWADASCLTQLEAELGLTLADGIFISYLLPSFDGWNKNNDRTVVCVMVFPDRGSVIGSYVDGTITVSTGGGST
jgi:hypothetical protein